MFKNLVQAVKDFFKRLVAKVRGQVQAKIDSATDKVNNVDRKG